MFSVCSFSRSTSYGLGNERLKVQIFKSNLRVKAGNSELEGNSGLNTTNFQKIKLNIFFSKDRKMIIMKKIILDTLTFKI